MRKPLVLVDSSIWIPFLRSRTADPSADLLSALLRDKRVATNRLIRLELLSGTATHQAYELLDADLAALHQLPLTEKVFHAASLLRWRLHRKGASIPVFDTLIAACAIFYDCPVLEDDAHFRLIAKHAPLHLHLSSGLHIAR